ncbi:MAG: N-acetylmuramoyl-L-alanine amidase [Synergistaceae bacterium]|nr:N-acetylmuramoyl-L-alanine amidase [Synergistaceae bacterium]
MRRQAGSFFLLLLLFLLCPLDASAGEGLILYSGSVPLGSVPSIKKGQSLLASAGVMAKLLEFSAVEKGDTFIISSKKSKLQLVSDAAAVWLDAELVPLAASCLSTPEGWFIETRSALKIFNGLLTRSGRKGDLQWKAGEKEPDIRNEEKAPMQPEVPQLVLRKSDASSSGSRPVLRGIRWGIEDEKIRTVLDIEGEGDPELQQSPGGVKLTFGPGTTSLPGMPSPCGDVKVAVLNFGDRILYEFASAFPVEIINLSDPRRIVLDFLRHSAQDKGLEIEISERVPAEKKVPPSSGSTSKGSGIVVIDPGHGGKDPGAVANGLKEKDINLLVSKKLAAALKKKGIDVRLTRNSDVYLTLKERTNLANKWNAEVFISIHANALPKGRHATGMEIYLMALPTDKDAMQLALIENRDMAEGNGEASKAADSRTKMLLNILGNMQQNAKISESTGFAEHLFAAGQTGKIKMRRVAQAPFFVLRGAAMPAVLIETGFLTEKSEARMLADGAYQNRMADSLAKGIVSFLATL